MFFFLSGSIPSEIILSKSLKWPKYGTVMVVATTMILLANIFLGHINIYMLSLRAASNGSELVFVGIPNILIQSVTFTLHFVTLFYLVAWINSFSDICHLHDNFDYHQRAKKCLRFYKSLQHGLGENI